MFLKFERKSRYFFFILKSKSFQFFCKATTDFVKNVNNFNVIYLLTQDVYKTKDQAMASSSAKEVDLLVTWLFRLTQEQYNYKMAAVIGIMVFIICAIFTLVCFRFINKKEATFS